MNRVARALLFVSWAIHDTEEWFTVGPWSRARATSGARNPTVIPWLSRGVSDRHQHVAILAIAAVAAVVAAAAGEGIRTRGSSPIYRIAVEAYGLHGFGHLAASVAVRGYTPGVATTPLTVLPYAWWARSRARREHGNLSGRARLIALPAIPLSLAACHAIGALMDRVHSRSTASKEA